MCIKFDINFETIIMDKKYTAYFFGLLTDKCIKTIV